jgi:hypothetical protein
MLKRTLALSLIAFPLFLSPAFAEKKHKGHGAHVHGHAKLSLVAEGQKLTAVFEVPSNSIYGFEYEPKTDAEKKKREEGGEKLKSNFEKMLILDKSLGCQFQNTKLNLHVSEDEPSSERENIAGKESAEKTSEAHSHIDEKKAGQHSETHAEFVANCQKPLAGTKVKFAFRKIFPAIKEINVQVVTDTKQSGAEIKRDKGEITL